MVKRDIIIIGTGAALASAVSATCTALAELGVVFADVANTISATTSSFDELTMTLGRMDYDRIPERHDFWNISGDNDKYRKIQASLKTAERKYQFSTRPRQCPSTYG